MADRRDSVVTTPNSYIPYRYESQIAHSVVNILDREVFDSKVCPRNSRDHPTGPNTDEIRGLRPDDDIALT